MEILIGLTILAVIVRVMIFFCAPELDETLSGFNSPQKNSYEGRSYSQWNDHYDGRPLNPQDSLNSVGIRGKYGSTYSTNLGTQDD